MIRTPVSSSNVESVGYDAETQTLEIAFLSGGIYQYFDVPQHVYDALMSAPSAGNFLHEQIKGVYRYARV